MKLILPVIAVLLIHNTQSQECLSRNYDHGGTVCVCSAEHCDTVPEPNKVPSNQYLVYTSNRAGLRFQKQVAEFTSIKKPNIFDWLFGNNQITISTEDKYQKIIGWGGAFTDAAAINILSLENDLQTKLLNSYFSKDGIEYNTCRVPIGGTDFSTRGYSYDDGEADPKLTRFALAEEDLQFKIPVIKKAVDINNDLQLFASAWTAPVWMKTNNNYAGGELKTEMYQSWADYFVKFLDLYKAAGVNFWGITTGNEPNTALVPGNKIPVVGWSPSALGNWIVNNLGPAIRNSNHSDIKIMVFDDQRLFLPEFVDVTLANETANNYIDGIAFHWYLNKWALPELLDLTHSHYPEKFILSTEACNGKVTGIGPVVLGSWDRGEDYSVDIITDLEHWVSGWVDWNMVLDTDGGPTYINNNVDAPIIVNASAGEFYKQPMYYNLGHFSKFIPKDSVRINSSKSKIDANILVVAFEKPDGGNVVVIINRNEQAVSVDLIDENRGLAQLELSEKSISTILYW